jgi:hypothetical protein
MGSWTRGDGSGRANDRGIAFQHDADGDGRQHPADGLCVFGEWPDRKALQQNAEDRADYDRRCDRDRHRDGAIQEYNRKDCAEHECVAMREVHRAGRGPHHMETDRDQGIDAADGQAG